MTVINSELTVHCKDVAEAKVQVNHRSYGTIVRFKFDGTNNIRIFLEDRDDFNKLFNILSWEVNEEVFDGSDEE
jgi:hypothetical protein